MCTYFDPHSPCGERHGHGGLLVYWCVISIHALLAESDQLHRYCHAAGGHFYPRSPCGERPQDLIAKELALAFLSTLSLRRATGQPIFTDRPAVHFYPRSPCGERHQARNIVDTAIRISIHALLAESDGCGFLPEWGHWISIHALLAESDPQDLIAKELALAFLSTLSLRRATAAHFASQIHSVGISIHALLAESDGTSVCMCTTWRIFLSTLSLRRATARK